MPDSIPPEIIELFLKHIMSADADRHGVEVCNLLCVSTTWRDIGLRLLWSDIVLDFRGLSRFVQCPFLTNVTLIKSLTISSEPPSDSTVPPPSPYTERARYIEGHVSSWPTNSALNVLSSVLPYMSQLETFSFYIKSQKGSWQADEVRFSRFALHQVIKALPSTIRSLEIDTKCYDRVIDTDSSVHLCHAIAQRMPTLLNLRLRLAAICPELVSASQTLRSCTICLHWPNASTKVVSCDAIDLLEDFDFERSSVTKALRRDLVASLTTKLTPSCNISTLQVVDATSSYRTSRLGRIDIRDLISAKTTSCPMQSLPANIMGESNVLIRYPTGVETHGDVAGRLGDIEELLEEEPWYSTSHGCRFLHSYKASSMGAKHSWPKRDNYGIPETWPQRLHDKNGVESLKPQPLAHIARIGGKTNLWEDEAQAGRRLAEVRVVDGVGDMEPLVRIDQKEKDNEERHGVLGGRLLMGLDIGTGTTSVNYWVANGSTRRS